MNLGLGNLAILKAYLLPPSLVAATDYDVQIIAIGKGVAAHMEQFCNRKFGRVVGETFAVNADRKSLVTERYPIETVTKIEIRDDLATGWVDQGAVNQVLFNIREEAGMLQFAGYLGASFSRLRVTYTGGYFFETAEPIDGGYPTATPVGSTPLPDELRLAWLQQCSHVWRQTDKLGTTIAEKPATGSPLLDLKWLPDVEDIILNFRRYAIT